MKICEKIKTRISNNKIIKILNVLNVLNIYISGYTHIHSLTLLWKYNIYISLRDFSKMHCYVISVQQLLKGMIGICSPIICVSLFHFLFFFRCSYRDPDNSASAMVEPTIRYCGLSSCPRREKASNAKLIMMQE